MGALLTEKVGRQVEAYNWKKLLSRTTKIPRKTAKDEGVVELVLLEKLLGTPKVTSKVRPTCGGGPGARVLEAGRSGARRWGMRGGGGVRPERSLGSGRLSSGKGARREKFLCPFPSFFPCDLFPRGRKER